MRFRSLRPRVSAVLAPFPGALSFTGRALLVWLCTVPLWAAPPSSKSSLTERPRTEKAQSAALLRERLAAGEFGAALDATDSLDDLTERVRQLKEITRAQRQGGDLRGAADTARRLPEAADRSRALGEVLREGSGSGGGSQADFSELMDLIRNTIDPEGWDEVGGPGAMRPYNTGVYVDPKGLLRSVTKEERSGILSNLARRARRADLNEDLARSSTLRVVSLTRLEQEVADRLAARQPILETMRRLAGLTQIRHVFADQQTGELLIAGPAEGWSYDEEGRPKGRESGRPLLDLDDLVVVLRAFAPGGDGNFGCSINTRDANLKAVKEFVEGSQSTGPLRPGQLGKWLGELQKRLGLQDVVVHGVPANTRVAQVLVEADYKMKLIGVARLDGGREIPSYFDLLRKSGQVSGAPLEALRWWLTMKYDAILHNAERTAFEIRGPSVRVQSENQFVNSRGQHVPTGVAEPVNRAFAENFTQHYAALAEREPVFADLRNIFDMALVAALLRQERLAEKIDWNLGAFGPQGTYRPAVVVAPQVVESVINHRVYGGKDIVVQVAGGVQADVLAIARDRDLSQDEETAALKQLARGAAPAEGRWWWDADLGN